MWPFTSTITSFQLDLVTYSLIQMYFLQNMTLLNTQNNTLWVDWLSLHLLSGVFRGGHDVLVRARLALADGVTMQVTVRSSEETVVDVILASVG